jgi:hypothetical protein
VALEVCTKVVLVMAPRHVQGAMTMLETKQKLQLPLPQQLSSYLGDAP